MVIETYEIEVRIENDPRGESEDYFPYMFVAYRDGKRSWFEGIRKKGRLDPIYEIPVREFLKSKGIDYPY